MSKVEWKHVNLNPPPRDIWLLLWIRPTGPFQKRLFVQGKFIKTDKESYFISYKKERIETGRVFVWDKLREDENYKNREVK